MGIRLTIIAVVFGLHLSAIAAAGEEVTIGLMEFAGKGGVPQEQVDVLADMLAEKIGRMGESVRVVTRADILSMLTLDEQKEMVDCDDTVCMSEIGGALGVGWMVMGSVALFGKTYVLNLKLVDAREILVASRVIRKVRGDEEDLVDELLDATHELFEKVADRLGLVATVTVASRHVQSLAESPSAVSVFTREDIRSSGATTVADFLRRVPGFDVYEMKPSFPLVGARALADPSNNLVLLLVDGREALIELAGFALWNALSIDLEEIERIEVVRGPGSSLYGANAFSGVVSITTVPGRPRSGANVYLSGGEGLQRLHGRVSNAWTLEDDSLDFSASLGTEGRNSPSDRRDEILNADYRAHGFLRYQRERSLDLSLHAGAVSGAGSLYIFVGDFVVSDVSQYYLMAKADVEFSRRFGLTAQLSYAHFHGTYHFRSTVNSHGIWLGDVPDFYMDSPCLDAQVQADYKVGDRLRLVGGANLRYTTLGSDRIIPPDITELRGAGFVHALWIPTDEIRLIGGFRFDLNSETAAALSPRAVLVYRPWMNHTFRLGYGLAFRKPNFVENHLHLDIDNVAFPEVQDKLKTGIGNEDLVNETIHSVEAGWRSHFFEERLRLAVDLFCNVYEDIIFFETSAEMNAAGIPDVPNSTFSFMNQEGRIIAVGGETEVSFSPRDTLSLWGNIGLRMVADEGGGRRLSEPVFKANLGCRWNPESESAIPGLVLDLALHYVSTYKMIIRDPEDLFSRTIEMPLGNALLAIGRVGYRLFGGKTRSLEAGLTLRVPLCGRFREYPGMPISRDRHTITASDLGGERIVRLAAFYLRGEF